MPESIGHRVDGAQVDRGCRVDRAQGRPGTGVDRARVDGHRVDRAQVDRFRVDRLRSIGSGPVSAADRGQDAVEVVRASELVITAPPMLSGA